MGEYLRQEVNPKFGLDIVLGATEEELSKITKYGFYSKFEAMQVMYAGPEKNDCQCTLGNFPKALARLKRVGTEIEKVYQG